MDLQIDAIQASLLITLLNSDVPLSTHTIGKQIGVSPRALRYRLPLLETWLSEQGAQLVVKPGQGISLIASPEAREKIQKELREECYQPILPNEERIIYLVFLLLLEEGNLVLNELQQELGVSRSTFLRDLQQAEKLLNQKQLSTQRLRLRGWRITGEEIAKRHALIEILYTYKIVESLLDISAGRRIEENNQTILQNMLLRKVRRWEVQEARRIIERIDSRLHLNLSDEDILYLSTYLACSYYRMQQGHFIVNSQKNLYREILIGDDELATIEPLLYQTKKLYVARIPVDEISQLLLEIHACQGKLTLKADPYAAEESLSRAIAERMIQRIENLYQCKITNDEIINQMTIHLSRALNRLRAGLPLHNPLTEDVKKAYAQLWQPTIETAQQIYEEMGVLVPEAELAYLVMYLALAVQLFEQKSPQKFRVIVSCPTGGVMARILVYRLQTVFPEIDVLDTVSLRDLHRYNEKTADLVITTVKRLHKTLPTITVNPLLGEDDIAKVKEQLKLIRRQKNKNLMRGLEELWQ